MKQESLRVLLVDPEPYTVHLLRLVLRNEGFEVYSATNSEEALELFATVQPQLIVLDVNLPNVDGLAVLRSVRQRDSAVGIVMSSANYSQKLEKDTLIAGADGWLTKPFLLKKLRIYLREVIEQTSKRWQSVL